MATTTNISAISEAEYGCEHLAVHFADHERGQRFREAFLNAQLARERLTSGIATANGLNKAPSSGLRPAYTCLDCSERYTREDRDAHAEQSKHNFFVDSRTGSLYCWDCRDLVYDHKLERVRSTGFANPPPVKKRTFSESSADEAYVRSNAIKRACTKEGVRGLFNLGQTCYLNVVLQSLLHDPLLSIYFLGSGHHPHECTASDCILCAMSEAFADFNSGDKAEGFAALNLLLATWKSSPMLAGYQQQDAHEFYQFLVDRLHLSAEGHEAVPDKKCGCFFHKAFYGKIRSSVTCDRCGNVTVTEDPMMDLSLDVHVQGKKRLLGGRENGTFLSKPTTLSGCLESFTAPERLVADQYNCGICGESAHRATKQLRIKKLPAILCMQLKRFEHTLAVSEKVEGRIDFPLSINMLPYTTKAHQKNVNPSKYVYDLASAVVHKGKLDAGHYYAYCRQGDQWFLFNDDQVTAASEAEVLNADAYLLFYTLRSLATGKE
ncbi:hypothetical protein VTN31DRAFT_5234 [Thermomyces dupontii]|uniref:uncharacterized protein n=1 Tax=Talaromyces thermophilus TaxID=28565 RepID=UPI00374336F8